MQQVHMPQISPVNKVLIIITAVSFVLVSALSMTGMGSIVAHLGLSAKGVMSGKVFQLITYPLIEKNFFSALFNGLLLWFIGSDLERLWGRKLYLKFIAFCTLGAGLFYILLSFVFFRDSIVFSFPLIGINSLTYGLIGAYAIIYADRQFTFMFLFPMKAMYFCGLLIIILLYQAFFSVYNKSAWAHLAGMAIGIGYLKFKSWRSSAMSRKGPKSSHLKLVKNKKDDDEHPKYWH